MLRAALHELTRETRIHLTASEESFFFAENTLPPPIKPTSPQPFITPPASLPPATTAKPIIVPTQKAPLPSSPITHSPFTEALAKIAPHISVLKETPSDLSAQHVMNRWKTKNQAAPLSILTLSLPPTHSTLLENIAKALALHFADTRIIPAAPIEKEEQWTSFLASESLKLILLFEPTLHRLPFLRHHYRETPTTGARTLGTIPLFFLPDLSLYLKDPLQKRALWTLLCQIIRPLCS